MTVLASGSKGNATVIAAGSTRVLVDAGLSCRELLRRMAIAGEDPAELDAILITHEHLDHVAGLAVLARRLKIPVFFTESTHRAWVRMLTPRTTMTYAKWLEQTQREKEMRTQAAQMAQAHAPAHLVAVASSGASVEVAEPETREAMPFASATFACDELAGSDSRLDDFQIPDLPTLESGADLRPGDLGCPGELSSNEGSPSDSAAPPVKQDPAFLPAVEYFRAGHSFSIGEIDISPFTIPHDAADPCGFVFHARTESIRMAIATDLGYIPPNVKMALRNVDVLLLESNHDLEMLKDGPYPWSVKQRVLSRVGHLSNAAAAEFLLRDYDGGAHTIVLGHLSEQNNLPELARLAAEQAIGDRLSLLGNRVALALQDAPLEAICL
jgi:phosphoribosyl 1,2-cyclic phosphodiesterase